MGSERKSETVEMCILGTSQTGSCKDGENSLGLVNLETKSILDSGDKERCMDMVPFSKMMRYIILYLTMDNKFGKS